jgi:hypothetical protein
MVLWLLVACATAPTSAPDLPPQLSGVLPQNRTIAGEVVLAADLLIPAGRSLTILPGTTVYVKPTPSTKIDPEWLSAETEILVRGTLRIEGTSAEPVSFVPLEKGADQGVVWAGILFDRSADSVVRHARIFQAETGILCIDSSPLIQESVIAESRYGLVIQNGSSPKVSGNLIRDGEAGVFCWTNSSPELRRNQIAGNEEEGLFIDRSCNPLLDDNRILKNDIGLAAYDPELRPLVGSLADNREDFRQLREGGGK